MNAYKVWGLGYYEIILAANAGEAKRDYWGGEMPLDELYQAGAGVHCRLIETNVIVTNHQGLEFKHLSAHDYIKSRYYDLVFNGIIHPDWAEERMVDSAWWWEDFTE